MNLARMVTTRNPERTSKKCKKEEVECTSLCAVSTREKGSAFKWRELISTVFWFIYEGVISWSEIVMQFRSAEALW